jgi:spore maturation protein SpmB
METVIDVVLHAGRSAVDVALYTLLPIMVVMMILMRVLEASGIIDKVVARLTPLVRPFGLTGLGVLAMIQISFISFVAPLPTLALMEDRGVSDRHLAAAFAAVLAMAPANAVFPLAAFGLRPGPVLALSALGGLCAAAATYWIFGLRLSASVQKITEFEMEALDRPSLLKIINVSGGEAIQIVINIIPLLLLSLVVVFGLQQSGAIAALAALLTPVLRRLDIDQALLLPTITKYLAGSTALVGVVSEMSKQGQITPSAINNSAGFLLHPLDVPGVAILVSAGVRLGRTCLPAIGGACVGIALRAAGAMLLSLAS